MKQQTVKWAYKSKTKPKAIPQSNKVFRSLPATEKPNKLQQHIQCSANTTCQTNIPLGIIRTHHLHHHHHNHHHQLNNTHLLHRSG